MTTKELLALVGKWRDGWHGPASNGYFSPPGSGARLALKSCADELAPIATALCAEVEALRKDAERLDWLEKNTLSFNLRYPPYMGWLRWKTLLHPSRAAIDAAKEPK